MLHIANIIRDQKFIDGQIAYHDLTSDACQHEYFILTWDKDVKFKYMSLGNRVRILTPDAFIKRLKEENFDAVFIHNFLYMPLHYMGRIPLNIKVFWFAWGYDIYNTPKDKPFLSIPLYHERSQQFLDNRRKRETNNNWEIWKRRVKCKIKEVLYYDQLDHNNEISVYKKAVRRVDYFAGIFPIEYDLLEGKSGFRAQKVLYEYSNPKDFPKSLPISLPIIGSNVIIGNSADINNNHLDILPFLNHIDFGNHRIYVPLSYGGGEEYIRVVEDAYKHALGDKCLIMKDYIPREEYYELLTSVGVGVFYHERQQATCNIEQLIKQGVKLYLSETSINYRYYKSIGLHIYSVQSDLSSDTFFTPLSDEEKWDNNKILYQTSTKEFRLGYLYNIYNLLKNK